MKRTLSVLLASTVVAAAAAVALNNTAVASSNRGSSNGPTTVGLTANGTLVTFGLHDPRTTRKIGSVTGLNGDAKLVGIDYRPADGKLYGVGDLGGVYTINRSTATATKASQLTIALVGTAFGVDFNPAADRLRVVSDTGQNLRHDVAGGVTVADLQLNTPPTVGPTVGITAVAYVNNDNDADTGTLLFDLDTSLDQTVAQVPANNGTLSLVGKFGVDATGDAGFDVYSKIVNGQAVSNSGWAVLQVSDRATLFKLDPTTGGATKVRVFPSQFDVVDLAIGLN